MGILETLKFLIDVVGFVTVIFAIIAFFTAIISWFFGVYPLFLRLGFARWSRKIAIVADNTNYSSLKSDLKDTGIFREKNIYPITSASLSKIKDSSLLLVHYQSFSEQEIRTILSYKKPTAGMIIYFPGFSNNNRIPDDIRDLINNEPFTITVNFRGRLLNDILTTMITTSYTKKSYDSGRIF
jgi:hypothetical protein